MNRNEFNRFVAGIDLPGPGDLEGLRELTALFPWFHSAHLVLLKGLRANSDIRFDSQLKASALSVSDREVLYHYLFLSPAEAAPEPENPAKEEVSSPVADVTAVAEEEAVAEVEIVSAPEEEAVAAVEIVSVPEEEVVALVEEVSAPEEEAVAAVETVSVPEEEVVAEVEIVSAPEEEVVAAVETVSVPEEEVVALVETVSVPEEEAVAEVEIVSAPEEEVSAPEEEAVAEVEIVSAPEEEAGSPVAEVAPDEPDDIPDSVEIPSEDEAALMTEEAGEILSPEEEEGILSPEEEEGILSPEEAYEISAPGEADGMLVSGEAGIGDEGQAEELPGPELSESEADAITGLRTREELVAEIEARLKELESYRLLIIEEQQPGIADEMVAGFEPEPEHVPEPESEPEPEPELESSPGHGSAPEPEIEEAPAPEPAELLELIPDTVAEAESPEKKLSPGDLIDRFIRISPTIERMSPKEYQPVRDLSEQGSDEPGKFITETLAKIYVNQGYYTRAINIYEKLALQYPEKSAYFASRIEKIKDLIK